MAVCTIRIYSSWFLNVNPYTQPMTTLIRMTDPYLRLFRGIAPLVFNIDISPMVAFLCLNFMDQLLNFNIPTTLIKWLYTGS